MASIKSSAWTSQFRSRIRPREQYAVAIGPRTCFWGGFGGSLIIMDQDLELTVAYVMNKMNIGLVGDTRGAAFALLAAIAAMS